jgi:hypothetical protein
MGINIWKLQLVPKLTKEAIQKVYLFILFFGGGKDQGFAV